MRETVSEIGDKNGKVFKMDISTPSNWTRIKVGFTEDITKTPREGRWRAVDKGSIRYNSGKTYSRPSHNGDLTTRDLLILGIDGISAIYIQGSGKFGMQLFEYEDGLGVNDGGEGFVIQPWVIGFTPGRITWSVID